MPTVIISLYGIVQGVGFRPFVARAANKYGISGSVANKGSFVEVYASGENENLEKFIYALKNDIPERAVVLDEKVRQIEDKLFESFEIIESEKEVGDIFVSPDIATCEACKKELFDKSNRRYQHPFINCTSCGPRLTILKSMPYDRERTTMSEFEMCKACEYEYTHSETRRYDAQPVCCNECGPEVYIVGTDKKNSEAITFARRSIMSGKIIAVKGIGGFHLCCNAADSNAVNRMRMLKNRPSKPFAVMLRDMDTVKRECFIKSGQDEFLDGHQKPILLLEKKLGGHLCKEIAPNNFNVGVMLPYAPLQMLLFDYDDEVKMTDCLVMTSGNVSGAPICRSDEDAVKEIGSFCDIILSHNRQILLRADDSVMDWFDGKPYMIRRSRGFAPLPIMVTSELDGQVLAIGGELKNTFCIGKNNLLYLSPYVGDMADIRTVNALTESIDRMESLLEAVPEAAVCDMHPKYNTVMIAEEMNLPLTKIQHHYAHILSCMAENDYFEKVIGFSFDGTGYGTDGTIWGGETLICDFCGFERVAHIQPFMQVGGDMSSKEGWRIAASLLHKLYGENSAEIAEKLNICNKNVMAVQAKMSDNKINAIVSTSCGRIFDGVSAILGIRRSSSFEGEGSIALEYEAESFRRGAEKFESGYTAPLLDESGTVLATGILIKYICDGVLSGRNVGELAYEFHYVLSEMICAEAELLRNKTGINICALSGGVFQNKLLLQLCKNGLEKMKFKVLLHSLCPTNDGGIALGQAAAALYRNKLNGGN